MSPRPENPELGPSNAVETVAKICESENPSSQKMSGEKKIQRHPDFDAWRNIFGIELHTLSIVILSHVHIFAAYSIYLTLTGKIPLSTFFSDLIFLLMSGVGITVGCHRYWSHKTFKATKLLQIILMIFQTMAFQYPIHKWSLDHRIHHKYTDTDKDPHNSKRGFYFSHIGWLFCKRHPEFQRTLDNFEAHDLDNDPIVKFQSRWYWTLLAIFHTIIPVTLIYTIWELPLLYCIAINYRRHMILAHFTYSVNSFAHMFGDRPYDKSISSADNPIVAFISGGEGWHNYHHTFPWDYKTSEFGWKINMSTIFIDLCAQLGLASDMKTVSQKMLKQRLHRTGDGSHPDAKVQENNENDFDFHTPPDVTELMNEMDHPIWGWNDERMTNEFRSFTKILNPDKQRHVTNLK